MAPAVVTRDPLKTLLEKIVSGVMVTVPFVLAGLGSLMMKSQPVGARFVRINSWMKLVREAAREDGTDRTDRTDRTNGNSTDG